MSCIYSGGKVIGQTWLYPYVCHFQLSFATIRFQPFSYLSQSLTILTKIWPKVVHKMCKNYCYSLLCTILLLDQDWIDFTRSDFQNIFWLVLWEWGYDPVMCRQRTGGGWHFWKPLRVDSSIQRVLFWVTIIFWKPLRVDSSIQHVIILILKVTIIFLKFLIGGWRTFAKMLY